MNSFTDVNAVTMDTDDKIYTDDGETVLTKRITIDESTDKDDRYITCGNCDEKVDCDKQHIFCLYSGNESNPTSEITICETCNADLKEEFQQDGFKCDDWEEETKEDAEEELDEDEFKCDDCDTVQGKNNCEMCDAEDVCEECNGQGGDYGPNEIWVCNECLPTCNGCEKKLHIV